MAQPTVREILEETIPGRLHAEPSLSREIGARVLFRITGSGGGEWTLDCTGPEGQVVPGAVGKPAMTVTCGDADFVGIATGRLNPNMAAMSGKLKLAPMDMALGLKLARLLG
ncbi:SCP2 sterol-binding domain-containing protein [Vulgatibacter incomptus]|uniref:Sterol-binding domain protein n=1 Tax=Vulgatibacter incomptus TaxID=1391653 RepID=A0A0K1PF49_9BACT|nr:SCP2 sterol-binding domain-containing protein [Vulgatibacter incomptus]AKU91724.1 Sterol-binding domain protein [Vulgatibacter incomptus]